MGFSKKRIVSAVLVVLVFLESDMCLGKEDFFHHQCGHGHHLHHNHHHDDHHTDHHEHHQIHDHHGFKLLEEIAEEEDMKMYGLRFHHHHDDHERDLSCVGLWVHAMGCSLLVSMASLICLILLPFIFIQGKPSKVVVDSLAIFGAGAMLGDAFLHQLPHAFGGGHSHSRDHIEQHVHEPPSHVHSLKDLSVGLSILTGIVLFLLVEKVVRYVDNASKEANTWGHSHHHHKKVKNIKNDTIDKVSGDYVNGEMRKENEPCIRKRFQVAKNNDDKPGEDTENEYTSKSLNENEPVQSPSNLVFGYLNLFSDGVHNFTDGMALGSAFYLYGCVGGWSRTLFLLAHELPQEIGDFGILVRSGFSVPKSLLFNFLSALVALAGTALALLLEQDSVQSSLIEGFTAGGFIYISVAGVLAEMNNNGATSVKSTLIQLTSLILGILVALGISLVE